MTGFSLLKMTSRHPRPPTLEAFALMAAAAPLAPEPTEEAESKRDETLSVEGLRTVIDTRRDNDVAIDDVSKRGRWGSARGSWRERKRKISTPPSILGLLTPPVRRERRITACRAS